MEKNSTRESLLVSSNVRTALLGVAVMLMVFLIAATISEVKGLKSISTDAVAVNTIGVNGHAEITAKPDIATFSFTVSEEAPDVKSAQDNAATKTNKIMSYLTSNGVAENDIETSGYNIYPNYASQNCGTKYPCVQAQNPRAITSYSVEETVTVKVRDTSKVGNVLSGIGSFDVQNVSGLQFTVDKAQDLQKQAVVKAIEDAKNNANDIAKALGVRVVRVISYYDNQPGTSDASYSKSAVAPQVAAATPDIATGENKVTSDVTVNFEIR